MLSACTSTVNKGALLSSIDNNISKSRAHINIIWYRGTKDGYHYLSHVYAMFGSKDYKIPVSELNIDNTYPLTTDSQKWMRISSISNQWLASRLNFETKEWIREDEGMHVK